MPRETPYLHRLHTELPVLFELKISPYVRSEFSCCIFDCFSTAKDGAALLSAFDLAPLRLQVTSLERSFCDKTFAVCDYYLGERNAERCSRHLYDLHKILPLIQLDSNMVKLYKRVRLERQSLPYCASADDGVQLNAVLREIIDTQYYAADYREVTAKLLNEKVSYAKAVTSLNQIARFLEDKRL
ncbi:MAG: nucleotidyl transferase AbiEii/AbiGii toxin family protein [Raoultibacter sp.]